MGGYCRRLEPWMGFESPSPRDPYLQRGAGRIVSLIPAVVLPNLYYYVILEAHQRIAERYWVMVQERHKALHELVEEVENLLIC